MDEVSLALAGAVVGATTEVALGRLGQVWKPLVALVRRRLSDEPEVVLPEDGVDLTQGDVERLADVITRLRESDEAFAREFDAVWGQVSAQVAASGGAVNVIGGAVEGTVVQAGVITGGVSIDGSSPAE